jgi:hypothetical protein
LDETKDFIKEINDFRTNLESDCKYRELVLSDKKTYDHIVEEIERFVSYIKYIDTIKIENFYRVRKEEKGNGPFTSRKDLIYPKKSNGRMNNSSFPVLYVLLHEYTAMAETLLDKQFIGKKFQLTRFSTSEKIKVFNLGTFSDLYFNSPRDPEIVNDKMNHIFGAGNHDTTLQNLAALECAG